MPAFHRESQPFFHDMRKALRRFLLRGIALSLGLTAAAGAAAADKTAEKSYLCTLVSGTRGGGVPEKIIVISADNFKTAYVYDTYMHHFKRDMIKVTPQPVSEGKYRMEWDLDGIKFDTTTLETANTIYLDTRRMRISYVAILKSYDNEIRGSGKCVLLPKKGKKK